MTLVCGRNLKTTRVSVLWHVKVNREQLALLAALAQFVFFSPPPLRYSSC